MLKKNKIKVIISSVIILLPILFGVIMWNKLPDSMMTHWDADLSADGLTGKAFAVFGLPIIFLVLNFVCLLITSHDKKQKEQDPKALRMIFWIMPVLSLFVSAMIYSVAFGKELNIKLIIPILLGAMFVVIGNYTPKIKQNRTLGIKIYWTLNNEENWNKTHRASGKVWVVGGLIILFSVFLPLEAMVWVMACVVSAMVVMPAVYSYYIYRQHKKEGISYAVSPKTKMEKNSAIISRIIIPIILIGTVVLMFTGNIAVECEDTAMKIDATYYADLNVDYSEIDSIEYRKDLDIGIRTNGFRSVRLSVGVFKNDEFGSYTLYSYSGAKEFVVLRSGTKTLVIATKNAEETKAIYDTLLTKTGV